MHACSIDVKYPTFIIEAFFPPLNFFHIFDFFLIVTAFVRCMDNASAHCTESSSCSGSILNPPQLPLFGSFVFCIAKHIDNLSQIKINNCLDNKLIS